MRTLTVALALSSMLTIEQRDTRRAHLDPPSAAVSADGRYVAFTTFSQLAPADVDDHRDVYVLDRVTQGVTLESLPRDRHQSSDSSHPGHQRRRTFLVYESGSQIALRDRREDFTRVLGEGRQPSISQNGRIAAFTSDTAKRHPRVEHRQRHARWPRRSPKPCRARRPSAQASLSMVATSRSLP